MYNNHLRQVVTVYVLAALNRDRPGCLEDRTFETAHQRVTKRLHQF